MSGPPPKRDAERRRRNKPAIKTEKVDLSEITTLEVEIPKANDKWHPIAKQWYGSLAKSGQALFYEPSDWWTAYALADQLDRLLSPQPIKIGQGEDARVEFHTVPMQGGQLTALLKGWTALMVTEADRRRLRMEIHREQQSNPTTQDDATVTDISQARQGRFARSQGT